MNKKILIKVMVVMVLFMSFLLCDKGISAYAETDSTGEWEYEVFSDAYITGYNGKETKITIPSEIDGYVVKGIDCFAFEDYSHLKSVTFPETLRSIEACAFHNCSGLKSIYIPKSVIWVAWDSFSGCSGLTSIVVDKDNKKYDSRNNCNAIIEKKRNMLVSGCKTTVIPKNVKKIGDSAFYGCTGLTGIKIPDGVKSIGEYAFAECTGLKSIVIPDSVTSIDSYAFDDIGKHFIVYSSADSCAHAYATERKIKWRDKNSKSLDAFLISLKKTTYKYDGKEKRPAVTVAMATKKLVKGTDYLVTYADNVKVGTATVTIMGIGNYSGIVTKKFAINPSQVKGVKQKTSYETNAITLTWKKMPGADGYYVYRATSENGTYKKVATVKDATYKNSKLKSGKTYYYKVCAYKSKVVGDASTVIAAGTATAKPTLNVKSEANKAVLTWEKVSGADGYEVYMRTGKSGKYKKVKTVSASITEYTKSKLVKGKTYSFKIKTYRMVSEKKIYSDWSGVKSVKIK